MLLFLLSKKKKSTLSMWFNRLLAAQIKKMVSIIIARKSMNTNGIINSFFSIGILGWYLLTEFYLSLTSLVFTDKKFSSVYTEGIDPSWNRKNLKKSNNTMTCKFLWMVLPMKLQLDSNRNGRIVTCHLYWHNCRWIDIKNNYVGNFIGNN